jgi:hypothetical protein
MEAEIMMNLLEGIRKEALARNLNTPKVIRNGGDVKGHWRHYKDHSTWVEATTKVAYQAVSTRFIK